MNLNSLQKRVLVVCAGAVATMLAYPPLQFRGVGRGYGWLFAIDDGLTVNAAQLLVQWVGVCLVGAIVFVLAGSQQPGPAGDGGPGLRARLRAAFLASQQWLWILLAMVVAAVVFAPDGHSAAVQAGGKLSAALVIYGVVFTWHLVGAGAGAPAKPAATTSWKRVGAYVVIAALSLLALLLWIARQPDLLQGQLTERPGTEPNPFQQFHPDAAAPRPSPPGR